MIYTSHVDSSAINPSIVQTETRQSVNCLIYLLYLVQCQSKIIAWTGYSRRSRPIHESFFLCERYILQLMKAAGAMHAYKTWLASNGTNAVEPVSRMWLSHSTPSIGEKETKINQVVHSSVLLILHVILVVMQTDTTTKMIVLRYDSTGVLRGQMKASRPKHGTILNDLACVNTTTIPRLFHRLARSYLVGVRWGIERGIVSQDFVLSAIHTRWIYSDIATA